MTCDEARGGGGTARVAGGFVRLPVAGLMAAWRACRGASLGVGDLRTWLAAREMVARRCGPDDGRAPAYGVAELARLLGVSERRARASIRKLVAAGLLGWDPSAITFPGPSGEGEPSLADSIGRGRGSVAIPRRMLRYLAYGAAPAFIATALGLLARCVSRRRAGWDGRGRFKASWVAATFDVDPRAASSGPAAG